MCVCVCVRVFVMTYIFLASILIDFTSFITLYIFTMMERYKSEAYYWCSCHIVLSSLITDDHRYDLSLKFHFVYAFIHKSFTRELVVCFGGREREKQKSLWHINLLNLRSQKKRLMFVIKCGLHYDIVILYWFHFVIRHLKTIFQIN